MLSEDMPTMRLHYTTFVFLLGIVGTFGRPHHASFHQIPAGQYGGPPLVIRATSFTSHTPFKVPTPFKHPVTFKPVNVFKAPATIKPFSAFKSPLATKVPTRYDFNYGIEDDKSGSNFGHSETRHGHNTNGKYFVNLPDDRRQTVAYKANKGGYNPTITYHGDSKHPSEDYDYDGILDKHSDEVSEYGGPSPFEAHKASPHKVESFRGRDPFEFSIPSFDNHEPAFNGFHSTLNEIQLPFRRPPPPNHKPARGYRYRG